MSVIFRTESGKIEFKMDKNDTLVSTLLSMYDGHEVPEVVILHGSVGEVIDEEHEALDRLILLGVPTPLSGISRIIRILDIDEGILRNAYADEKVNDRFSHYRFLGEMMNEKMHKLINAVLDSEVMGHCGNVIRTIDDVGNVMIGCIYNACLMTQMKNFHLSMIHWNDFIELIPDDDRNVRIIAMLKLFAGRGDKNATLSSLIDISSVILDMPLPSTIFIYERLLDLFPDNIEPADFGLSELVMVHDRAKAYTTTNDALTILRPIHSLIVARTRYHANREGRSEVTEEDMRDSFISRKSLERISTSLKHYLSVTWHYDAYSFRKAIVAYLSRLDKKE